MCYVTKTVALSSIKTIKHSASLACHLPTSEVSKRDHHPFKILTAFFPSSVLDNVRAPAR